MTLAPCENSSAIHDTLYNPVLNPEQVDFPKTLIIYN